MKKLLSLLMLLSSMTLAAPTPPAKPYKRALVFSAGGFNTAIYGAILEALRYKGWVPDVIVSNCGASVAAANYLSFPNLEQHQNYLFSEDHHQRLFSADLRYKNIQRLYDRLEQYPDHVLPDIFTDSFLLIDQDIQLRNGIRQFPTQGTRLVVTAGKLLFSLADAGKPRAGRRAIQEVYFTDPETAAHLKGFTSPIQRYWPESGYLPEVELRTDVEVFKAVRASITDPFLMEPGIIDNDLYVSSESFPVEAAHYLADEVLAIYPEIVEDYLFVMFQKGYNYPTPQRMIQVGHMPNTRWIDILGQDKTFQPKRDWLVWMKKGVPEFYDEFLPVVEKHWNFGWQRGLEAVAALKNDNPLAHVRKSVEQQLMERGAERERERNPLRP